MAKTLGLFFCKTAAAPPPSGFLLLEGDFSGYLLLEGDFSGKLSLE